MASSARSASCAQKKSGVWPPAASAALGLARRSSSSATAAVWPLNAAIDSAGSRETGAGRGWSMA